MQVAGANLLVRAHSLRSCPHKHLHKNAPRACIPSQWARCSGSARTRSLMCHAWSGGEVPDASYDFVSKNQDIIRSLPIWAGGLGFVGLLANRTLSGIAPVVDASSSQSRADVLGILLSAVLLLTGLQWLALKPKPVEAVALDGQYVDFFNPETRLPLQVQRELSWAWKAFQSTSRATSMVVIHQGRNIFHAGMARAGIKLGKATAGDVCSKVMESGKGNYLANLILYPGRAEFVEYLPEATQGVLVQPIGSQGVLIIGCDTVRGISRLDQAWVATVADKLEVSLEDYQAAGTGFGAAAAGKAARLKKGKT